MTSADNSDPRDYVLDLSTGGGGSPMEGRRTEMEKGTGRAFLSIHFKCCNVYARIYKNKAGTAYAGVCPRCLRAARVGISRDGSTFRIFQAE